MHPPTSRKERSATEKERSDKLDPTETRGRQDARVAGFSVSFETSHFAQFPRFEFAFGVEAIRVVHVGVNFLRLLCGRKSFWDQFFSNSYHKTLKAGRRGALEAISRTILSATRAFASSLRFRFLALRFESFRVELLLSLGDRIAVPSGRRVLAISSM